MYAICLPSWLRIYADFLLSMEEQMSTKDQRTSTGREMTVMTMTTIWDLLLLIILKNRK
jgi:hypothetical protein